MEYFVLDSRIIQKFTKHYATKEVIHLTEKLVTYQKWLNALITQMLVFQSAFDQACHSWPFLHHSFSDLVNQVWDLYRSPTRLPVFGSQQHGCTLLVEDYREFMYSMCDSIINLA
ncbi:hypothetical protein AVEN_29302-1 [Araneus ventricosus]|uniref:Uncharacterized protein n=1 Tax=Araneus ventricosus TaxID=182803 RepID=A0A4Y2QP14_ARAVE|nr:hypothetical protein AVEN_71146-1 [Araneus ventricosus]GBN65104.1 hypothetical protein AVEN_29302-1 [Araneus ventricosus]